MLVNTAFDVYCTFVKGLQYMCISQGCCCCRSIHSCRLIQAGGYAERGGTPLQYVAVCAAEQGVVFRVLSL